MRTGHLHQRQPIHRVFAPDGARASVSKSTEYTFHYLRAHWKLRFGWYITHENRQLTTIATMGDLALLDSLPYKPLQSGIVIAAVCTQMRSAFWSSHSRHQHSRHQRARRMLIRACNLRYQRCVSLLHQMSLAAARNLVTQISFSHR